MSRMKIGMKLLLVLLPVLALLAFLSLRSIPTFTIQTVRVEVQGGSNVVPAAVAKYLATLRGKPMFAVNLLRERRLLKQMPLVEQAYLKRRLPSTLGVQLNLAEAQAVVVEDEGGSAYVVTAGKLTQLDPNDVAAWKKVAVTIEVPASYAAHLLRYGTESSFQHVMELAKTVDGRTNLITTIKYDNNSSNSFGKMVLELSSLDALIWVREPVSAAHVQTAVSLVQEDRKDALSFLSSGTMRYDLYREGLVRRR